MYRKEKIPGTSVTVIAGAEEHNIAECLDSVAWADELIVLCSKHEDRTLDIALEHTVNAEFHPFTGYAAQKRAALERATKPWVLSVDADERIPAALADEIAAAIESPGALDGYFIPRKNHLLGKWVKHAGNYPDLQLRLFRRGAVSITDRLVHEGFVVEGRRGTLVEPMLHFTNPSIRHMLEKNLDYAYFEAVEKCSRRKATIGGTFARFILEFTKKYVLKGGFRDGWPGFVVSAVHAMDKLQVQIYMWEMQQAGKRGDGER
jgi:glycosyltransferase involved in cell wall biosynthesis